MTGSMSVWQWHVASEIVQGICTSEATTITACKLQSSKILRLIICADAISMVKHGARIAAGVDLLCQELC